MHGEQTQALCCSAVLIGDRDGALSCADEVLTCVERFADQVRRCERPSVDAGEGFDVGKDVARAGGAGAAARRHSTLTAIAEAGRTESPTAFGARSAFRAAPRRPTSMSRVVASRTVQLRCQARAICEPKSRTLPTIGPKVTGFRQYVAGALEVASPLAELACS